MAPAKKFFLDGKRTSEREFANTTVRAPDTDLAEYERAPMQALSGYDVGEVPFVMQAVCYYEETLDVGVLERGLRATLAKYPMLAGRLDLRVPANAAIMRLQSGVCRLFRNSLHEQALHPPFLY